MDEKVKLTFEYSLKTIKKTENPCASCVLRVDEFGCYSRKSCKYTDENPQVYYFEGLVEPELKNTLLRIIDNYMQRNPKQRFAQVLFNLGINQFADPNNPEAKNFLLRDIYNDLDDDIFFRIGKQNM